MALLTPEPPPMKIVPRSPGLADLTIHLRQEESLCWKAWHPNLPCSPGGAMNQAEAVTCLDLSRTRRNRLLNAELFGASAARALYDDYVNEGYHVTTPPVGPEEHAVDEGTRVRLMAVAVSTAYDYSRTYTVNQPGLRLWGFKEGAEHGDLKSALSIIDRLRNSWIEERQARDLHVPTAVLLASKTYAVDSLGTPEIARTAVPIPAKCHSQYADSVAGWETAFHGTWAKYVAKPFIASRSKSGWLAKVKPQETELRLSDEVWGPKKGESVKTFAERVALELGYPGTVEDVKLELFPAGCSEYVITIRATAT